MADKRIYVVHNKHAKTDTLVEATNKSQAIRHAADGNFDARVASQQDLVKFLGQGKVVEQAGEQND